MKHISILLLVLFPTAFSSFSVYTKQGHNGSCPIVDDEVCGTNNVTYQNECFLQRAGTAKAYDGWCINGQNPSSPATVNTDAIIHSHSHSHFTPISGEPPAPPQVHIETAIGGSQLIITQWFRNEHNGYLSTGEHYVGCPCNDSSLPVCGANGLTYSNMCRAECANIKAVKYGECGDYNYQWAGPSSCLCPFEIDTSNAVCGVNNRTYESKCVANCRDTPIKGGGFCKNKCNCDHYFKPVCGRDGATYDNACKLDCLGVGLLHEGICSKMAVDACYFCKGNFNRVCGSDGKTYDNECYLKCGGAQKKSNGACPKKKGEKCHCPDVELPVCGMDEVTYKNSCELECKGIPKLANKACYLYKREQNSCKNKCRDQAYEPVCGANGKTFNNKCDAGCGGSSILSNGPCGSVKNPSHCVCSDEPMPVCGVDGRDYLNKCAIECAGVALAWEGPCNMHQSQSGAAYKTGQITAGGPYVDGNLNINQPTPPAIPAAMAPPMQAPAHYGGNSGMSISQHVSAPANLAPSFMEIQQIIDLKLAQHSQANQNIIVLPPIQSQPTQNGPIEVSLQFVNPDGTKTDIDNEKVSKHTLSKRDFVSQKNGDPMNMRLKMDKNMSLKQLYSMISLNPSSFYSYFSGLIKKGIVSESSIMFKGLSLGKMMKYIKNQFNLDAGTLIVGSSK